MTQPLLTHSSAAVAAIFFKNPSSELYGMQIIEGTGSTKGTVYPMLSSWEKRGWLRSRWETKQEMADRSWSGSPRRYYQLTDAGRTALTEYLARWDARRSGSHDPI